jgi:hypothetical protein
MGYSTIAAARALDAINKITTGIRLEKLEL